MPVLDRLFSHRRFSVVRKEYRAWLRRLLVFWLVASVGMQWALTQSAGWVSMLLNYSKTHSIGAAIEMTFDGEHPCELCLLAQKQSSDSEDDAEFKLPKLKKAEIAWSDEMLFPVAEELTTAVQTGLRRSWTPWERLLDKPPPRAS
jgi:hypothetical protein